MINTHSTNYIQSLVDDCIQAVQLDASQHKVNVSKFVESDNRISPYTQNPPIKPLLINLLKRCIHSLNEGDLLLLVEESHLPPVIDRIIFTLRGVGHINESTLSNQIYSLIDPTRSFTDEQLPLSPLFHFERENNHGFILWFSVDLKQAFNY